MSKFLEEDYDNLVLENYYNILEIETDATDKEIKTAYMKLAKKYHPDHGGNSDLFKQVTKAYEILSHKESKKEYDLKLSNNDDDKIDNYEKLRNDFKTYKNAIDKPLEQEKIDSMYDELFTQIKDEKYDTEILNVKMNDIELERKTVDIETNDETIKNLLNANDKLDNDHKLSVSDIYDFVHTQKKSNTSNQLFNNTIGTIDTLGGHFANDCSLFMNDSTFLANSSYSNLDDPNSISQNDIKDIKLEDIIEWKKTKKVDAKLSDTEIENFMKQRELEIKEIQESVKNNLKDNIKETQNYLKIKNIDNEINFDEFLTSTENFCNKNDTNFSNYFD